MSRSNALLPFALLLLAAAVARAQDDPVQQVEARVERLLTRIEAGEAEAASREFFEGSTILAVIERKGQLFAAQFATLSSELGRAIGHEKVASGVAAGVGSVVYVVYLERTPAFFYGSFALRQGRATIVDASIDVERSRAIAAFGRPLDEPAEDLVARSKRFLESLAVLEIEKAFREIALEPDRELWLSQVEGAVEKIRSQVQRIQEGNAKGWGYVGAEALGERTVMLHYAVDHGVLTTFWSFGFYREGDAWHVVDVNFSSEYHEAFWRMASHR